LKYVTSLASDDLQGVVSVEISNDGKYAYAAAYQSKAVVAFSRDPKTGLLTLMESLADAAELDGVTALRLSPDNKLAVSAAFRSKAAVLYSRDAKTGKLKREDAVKQGGQTQALLDWAIDAAWSPDSNFVYVIASYSNAVNVFRVTAQSAFEFVQVEQGEGQCFVGARGIAVSPDGKHVYVAADRANALTVLKRDPQTGKLEMHQTLKHGEAQAKGLSGAFSVAVSSDGKFVYLSSGRFQGSDAISVFEKQNDGKLEVVDEMFNFTDKLERFVGGNEIILSKDGKQAFAVGSKSDSLVAFDRDPKTGKLKQTQFLVDNFRGVGAMLMPGGVGVSPDGRFVYVAAEGSGALAIFERPDAVIPAKKKVGENGR
jgi:6-phosphogluconolactonase (cycloisomerase 2 family)